MSYEGSEVRGKGGTGRVCCGLCVEGQVGTVGWPCMGGHRRTRHLYSGIGIATHPDGELDAEDAVAAAERLQHVVGVVGEGRGAVEEGLEAVQEARLIVGQVGHGPGKALAAGLVKGAAVLPHTHLDCMARGAA